MMLDMIAIMSPQALFWQAVLFEAKENRMLLNQAKLLVVAASAWAFQASAQVHNGHPPAIGARDAAPYAGFEQRRIKALSDEQVADLRTGRGMGLALAAELNGYPGPAHVLELADRLDLTDEQRRRTKALMDAMKAETVAIGERIIADESLLNRRFASGDLNEVALIEIAERIGLSQGRLRAAHLKYHLPMRGLLSKGQVAGYNELRGYSDK
jgi:Spy/CpxP family protein refolding chaperone